MRTIRAKINQDKKSEPTRFGQHVPKKLYTLTPLEQFRLHLIDIGDLTTKQVEQYARDMGLDDIKDKTADDLRILVHEIHAKDRPSDIYRAALEISDDTTVHRTIEKLIVSRIKIMTNEINQLESKIGQIEPKLEKMLSNPLIAAKVKDRLRVIIKKYRRRRRKTSRLGIAAAAIGGGALAAAAAKKSTIK